jgi:hypothetical protein
MAKQSSKSDSKKRPILEIVDTVTEIFMLLGGGLFVVITGYLLFGLFTGTIAHSLANDTIGKAGLADNLKMLRSVAFYSGIAALIGVIVRYSHEEVSGYIMLVLGAIVHWGTPAILNASLPDSNNAIFIPIIEIEKGYILLGTIAMILSIPSIALDVWRKGITRESPKPSEGTTISGEKDESSMPLYAHCWQTPYCRDYLRKHCSAYKSRKDCWRIKTGCYCDEDMMLQSLKSSTGVPAGIPGIQDIPERKKGKLTQSEKKRRCATCMMYMLHQRQKYKLLSPMMFPLGLLIMFVLYIPIMSLLHTMVAFTDKLASAISVMPTSSSSALSEYSMDMQTSGAVEWVMFICIGLILISVLLRTLEYMIYELQV